MRCISDNASKKERLIKKMSDLELLLPAIISHHRLFVEIMSDDKFYFQKK
jgi:hypothetical protein